MAESTPWLQRARWQPIETAPKDGRLLRLLVEFTDHATEDTTAAAPTIGHNDLDGTGDDRWQFAGWCWSHDHWTEGEGKPVAWLPLIGDVIDAETQDAPWQRDDETTLACILLLGEDSTGFAGHDDRAHLARIAAWTDDECRAVEDWCRAVHVHASDNDDHPVPPKPACLGPEVAGDGTGEALPELGTLPRIAPPIDPAAFDDDEFMPVTDPADLNRALVEVAQALECTPTLEDMLHAVDDLRERVARTIDRRLEVVITTTLGCDSTPTAIAEALRALVDRAGPDPARG